MNRSLFVCTLLLLSGGLLLAQAKPPGKEVEQSSIPIRQQLEQVAPFMKGHTEGCIGDVLDYIAQETGVQFVVNRSAFATDLGLTNFEEHPVRLPKLKVKLSIALRLLLSQANATYLVRPDFIEITTIVRTRPEDWGPSWRSVVPVVNAEFHRQPLRAALRELAGMTGINVVLDRRAEENSGKALITTTLTNVPLDTAVRLLADMADLKAAAVDNVLYVTTSTNAAAIEIEQEKRREMAEPTRQVSVAGEGM